MNFGYIRTATFTPKIKVADVKFNTKQIIDGISKAYFKGVNLLVFPELCLTGYSVGDLVRSKPLLNACVLGLKQIADFLVDKNMLVFVGLPIVVDGKLYNACAGISNGKVLGIVPKSNLVDSGVLDEKNLFSVYNQAVKTIDVGEGFDNVLFGTDVIFNEKSLSSFTVSVEIGEDVNSLIAPSVYHSYNGAKIIAHPSAFIDYAGRDEKLIDCIKSQTIKTKSVYVSAGAGEGESSTDCVFSGFSAVACNGELLCKSEIYKGGLTVTDVDLDLIDFARAKDVTSSEILKKEYARINFSAENKNSDIIYSYDKTPFIVVGTEEDILTRQAYGLKKRIEHINPNKIVLGLSGGLDSTLALIVAVKAMKLIGRNTKDILAITMPCFGTTSRTLDNSIKLAKAFNVSVKKIDIGKSVVRHLKDIGHEQNLYDVAYENAQARERTQVLMDVANMNNGIVVGTGDLSELALGWATYNGDHMSNYAVNSGVPKTLVRHLTEYVKENSKGKLKAVLSDILDTPISPELIPPEGSNIKQKTEDLVGPYILHDFFIYHMLKNGFSPKKLYFIAQKTFSNTFDNQTILKWLKTFIRRFFNQQFKRSCMPDGVRVGEISLSPRAGLKMPSDAVSSLWLDELEDIK